jgi:hypothetical protein
MPDNKSPEAPVPVVAEKPVAEKTAVAGPAEKKPAAAKPPAIKVAATKAAATAKAAPVKSAAPRLSKLEETKAKNKKALADALAKAQAVKLVQQPSVAPVIKARTAKAAKSGKKPKLVRHAFSMPEVEYAQIVALKKRIASLGGNVKRSELLRAGVALLAVLDNVELTAVMARVDRIKTGRPAKKG